MAETGYCKGTNSIVKRVEGLRAEYEAAGDGPRAEQFGQVLVHLHSMCSIVELAAIRRRIGQPVDEEAYNAAVKYFYDTEKTLDENYPEFASAEVSTPTAGGARKVAKKSRKARKVAKKSRKVRKATKKSRNTRKH